MLKVFKLKNKKTKMLIMSIAAAPLFTPCLNAPVALRPALLKSPVCSDWSVLTVLRHCDVTTLQKS